jgi:DNA-binding HxlR family transcriptional regulator
LPKRVSIAIHQERTFILELVERSFAVKEIRCGRIVRNENAAGGAGLGAAIEVATMDLTASFPAPAPEMAGNGNQAPYLSFLEAMRPLTGKWKIEILWILAQGTHRFGELRRALPGITQHMLSLRLRELEADGLVRRTVYAESVPRVEYDISEAVYGLKPVFRAVIGWSQQFGPLSRRRDEPAQNTGPEAEIAA